MATNLYCPECNENLGKDTENSIHVICGNCGGSFKNEEGYNDDNKKKIEIEKDLTREDYISEAQDRLHRLCRMRNTYNTSGADYEISRLQERIKQLKSENS